MHIKIPRHLTVIGKPVYGGNKELIPIGQDQYCREIELP
jgi:hypothetical protein